MKTVCVILAAGLGTRMNSSIPKVLHKVCGIPMLQSVINTAENLKPEKIIVVTGKHINMIKESVKSRKVSYVLQKDPKGTAHALSYAKKALKQFKGLIVVLNGDTPLMNPDTVKKFLKMHMKDKNDLSVLSFKAENTGSYGKIIRSDTGRIVSIIEHRDADRKQRRINEVNSGVYAFNNNALSLLDKIKVNRLKGEYYLTDIVSLSYEKGLKTSAYCLGFEYEFLGVNTRKDLCNASMVMKKNIINKWIDKGVNFLDTKSVFIHPDVFIGKETTIYPNVYIEGHSRIGRGVTIYPNVRILNSSIGNNVIIRDATVIEDSIINDKASVGPFTHIRPGSQIGSEARIGNFVELKKAIVGKKTKASHLSYLGDTKIGSRVNIGAGTITCNYDGKKKHITVIDDDVFIGSDSQLIAPVSIGKGAYVGAGSTITKNVPAWALAISRAEQRKILNWTKKKKLKAGNKKSKDGNK